MKRLHQLPLKILLPLIVLVLYTFMLGLMMIYQNHTQNDKLVHNSRLGIKQRLSVLQSELESSLIAQDFEHAERTIKALGMINEVFLLSVVNENGRILMATKSQLKGVQAQG